MLDKEAAALATARAAPPPRKGERKPPETLPVPPQPASVPRRPAGSGVIVETGWGPVPSGFAAENFWGEQAGTVELSVYAGAPTSDPSQGLVAVLVSRLQGGDGWYPTPAKAGSVHIVSAVGERLTLQSRSGAVFEFDVPTRRFVQP